MRSVAIDTNAYTAFKRGDRAVVTVLRHAPQIFVGATVLGELLAGFAVGSRENANRVELTRFLDSPRVKQVPCGPATADLYALIYAALRRQGRPIPTNDLWIAASCLEHGVALLTLDAHFRNVGGLRVGATLDDFLP
ncbi:MAG: type II toxin-antitoxin system VapC family toxin [Gammaproteobacteria bacterium]|nr:type II toxin-antitoxin system VapC family toxin [Gammaproteobacteria bacterium]